MKKIIATAFTGAALVFALNSCNKGGETAEQVAAADNARIDSIANAQLGALTYDAECQAYVDSAAQAQYDEWYTTEGKKKGAKPAPKPKPKPEEPKKEEPKPNTLNNRPGTNENQNTGTLNNRPGSNESQTNKENNSLNSRPGATKTGSSGPK